MSGINDLISFEFKKKFSISANKENINYKFKNNFKEERNQNPDIFQNSMHNLDNYCDSSLIYPKENINLESSEFPELKEMQNIIPKESKVNTNSNNNNNYNNISKEEETIIPYRKIKTLDGNNEIHILNFYKPKNSLSIINIRSFT